MTSQRSLINAARFVSIVFAPFYLPIVGLIVLFWFSYLSLLPLSYKLLVLLVVYIFTVLLPVTIIRLYRRYHGWSFAYFGNRERRMIPYAISIVCYFTCVYVMDSFHIPHFMSNIVSVALFLQIACALVNVWWNISTHTAAIGAMTGALFAFAEIFMFNPVWWFCLLVVIAGILGTSRMLLRQHTLGQVVFGYLLGVVFGAFGIIYI